MSRGALALQGWLPVVLMVWLPSVAAFAAHPGAGLARRDARGFVNAGIPERRARPAAVWCARRQASIMQGWLDNFLGSPSAATTSSLPPGWSAEVDPASGSTYFYNAQTGETTWDRPADVSTTQAPSQAAAQPPADVTRVPRSYEEIHDDAIAGVLAGLDAGVQRLEVEFPAIAQTNKISDGSASSQAIVRRANVEFNTKVCSALASRGQRVVVLCSEGSTLQAMLEARLPDRAVCGLVKDAGGMGITRGDVVVSCQPADAAAWMTCAALAAQAPVVVLNGFQYNGYKAFEMAYYLKPMTFNSGICGYCIRRYPNDWVVWSAKTASPLPDYKVSFVEAQGCLRPDLQRISLALTN